MDDMTDIHCPVSFDIGDDGSEVENAIIRVIGVGGGGGNAVAYMLDSRLGSVDFIVANTDGKALKNLRVANQIRLGQNITKGLGAGSSPELGQKAALEEKDIIKQQLAGSDMVFITAGMGGGTGTGASPIVAQIAKEIGALTVAVVTKPFHVEGKRKIRIAEQGIEELAEHVDALIVVPNQKLLKTQKQLSFKDALGHSNTVLLDAVRGISELITKPGLLGLDFADVRTAMAGMGPCVVGCGAAKSSPSAARDACIEAIENPLLEDANLEGAKGVLANITGGENLSIQDYEEVGEIIGEFADEDAVIKIGTAIDNDIDDGIKVTIVATGIEYFDDSNDVRKNKKNHSTEQPNPRSAPKTRFAGAPWNQQDQSSTFRREAEKEHDSAQVQTSYPKGADIDIPAYVRKRQMD